MNLLTTSPSALNDSLPTHAVCLMSKSPPFGPPCGSVSGMINPHKAMHFSFNMALFMVFVRHRCTIHGTYITYSIFIVPDALFPPQHTCKSSHCLRALKGQLLTKVEQRQAILYTLDRGPIITKHVHLQCERKYYVLFAAEGSDCAYQTARLHTNSTSMSRARTATIMTPCPILFKFRIMCSLRKE